MNEIEHYMDKVSELESASGSNGSSDARSLRLGSPSC